MCDPVKGSFDPKGAETHRLRMIDLHTGGGNPS